VSDILSPLAEPTQRTGHLIDFNVRAERMGWLPSSPQLATNPLELGKAAEAAGEEPTPYAIEQLRSGAPRTACEAPDTPSHSRRNLFVWRANLRGASGKGHEYFLKHLLGAENGVLNLDLEARGEPLPEEVVWRSSPPEGEGKLDLLVGIDFRMC